MSREYWLNETDMTTELLGEKPVPAPLCPPQIPHGLYASTVTG